MNLPFYSVAIPRFTFKNWRLKKIRGTPRFLVTPVSVTVMKWGNMEMKEGTVYQNMELKTFTVLDGLKFIKNCLIVFGIGVFVIGFSLMMIELMGLKA
jgi:hypothetical protein